MEIKIQCNCGTKYKFEFEPVDCRVPFAVVCPNCKTDATAFANAHVAQQLATDAPAAAAATTPEPARPKLRIGTIAPTPAVPAEDTPSATPAPPPKPIQIPTSNVYAQLTPPDEGLTPRFFYGVGGAAIGTLLACGIWYLIFHFTGVSSRLFGLLVGAGGGFGARLLSKDEGSGQLGMITCVIVLSGVAVTAYNVGRDRVHNAAFGLIGAVYKEQVAYAKRAVKAVPNGTEDEIRAFLTKEEAADGNEKPAAISAREVRLFRDVRLEQCKQLASGKITARDYPKAMARWGVDERVAEAKYAIEVMPHESEKEIRDYLARESVDPGQKPDPQSVTADQITMFRTTVLPEYKKLANGETQFKEGPDVVDAAEKGLKKVEETESGWMSILYFFSGWGLGGIGLMCATLGLAYKACTHASG